MVRNYLCLVNTGFNKDIMKLSESAELGVKLLFYQQNVTTVIFWCIFSGAQICSFSIVDD